MATQQQHSDVKALGFDAASISKFLQAWYTGCDVAFASWFSYL
jgi:hypothetical protein